MKSNTSGYDPGYKFDGKWKGNVDFNAVSLRFSTFCCCFTRTIYSYILDEGEGSSGTKADYGAELISRIFNILQETVVVVVVEEEEKGLNKKE